LAQDCDALITAYLPALVQYIQAGENGTVACGQIGLCNNTAVKPILKLSEPIKPAFKLSAPQPKAKAKGIECTICSLLINLAESILGSNASESAIENFLENDACGILPKSLAQDCDALVTAYLPALVQYIQTGENGTVACTQMGLCNGTSVRPILKLSEPIKPAFKLSAPQPKERSSIECAACTALVTISELILGTNASETAIENFLDNTACSYLPKTLQTVCDSIVTAYLPALVQYIQTGENGNVACTQMGLCNSTAPFSFPDSPELKRK